MIKRLMNCLHPKQIRNKYTGQILTVRCGKCIVCKNAHAASWVQRLEQESIYHRYTYFVTLQYDESHVPQMVRLDPERSLSYPSYIDIQTSEVISLLDCPLDDQKRDKLKEVEFCNNTKVLNVLSKRDIQLFIKRLRKRCNEIDPDYGRLRFYLCGEYGPQTFRPHYHCLFFFDSERVAKVFEKCLFECWQFGTVFDPHSVAGDAAEYVASYVNCTAHIPQILLHKSVKPFSLYSRFPIIGNFKNDSIDLRKLFFEASDEMRLYVPKSNKFVLVPLWRSLKNRLFPRIPCYSNVPDQIRILLYCSLYSYYVSGSSETDVRDTIKFGFRTKFFGDSIVRRYLETILFHRNEKTGITSFSDFSLSRYVHSCYLTYQLASDYAIDVYSAVKQIIKYYENCEISQLRDYLRFQESYFLSSPVSDYPLFDSSFVEMVNGKMECDLSDWQKVVLTNCGISLNPVVLDYSKCIDYRNMVSLHTKIAFDTSKSKKSNDYLLANKDKFGNIITYKNL